VRFLREKLKCSREANFFPSQKYEHEHFHFNPKLSFLFNPNFLFRQNNFDQLCNAERGWAFERMVGASLEGFNHKVLCTVRKICKKN
jgi:hypothetical protein